MMPGVEFAQQTIDVPNDSALYVFSDGAYEITRPDGSMWGLDAFEGVLRDAATERPSLDPIEAKLREVRGQQTFEDDVSILEIRFNGGPQAKV